MGDPNSEYRPPITFVVVQKRHHTRLFPGRPNEGDRSGNILPGELLATVLLHYTNNMQSLCWFFLPCAGVLTVVSFVAVCAAGIRCEVMSVVMCIACCCQPSFDLLPLNKPQNIGESFSCSMMSSAFELAAK